MSTFENPKFEFAFEIDLSFTRTHNIENMPTGAGRGAVYLDSGTVKGPRLNGIAIPGSGGDRALPGFLKTVLKYLKLTATCPRVRPSK